MAQPPSATSLAGSGDADFDVGAYTLSVGLMTALLLCLVAPAPPGTLPPVTQAARIDLQLGELVLTRHRWMQWSTLRPTLMGWKGPAVLGSLFIEDVALRSPLPITFLASTASSPGQATPGALFLGARADLGSIELIAGRSTAPGVPGQTGDNVPALGGLPSVGRLPSFTLRSRF